MNEKLPGVIFLLGVAVAIVGGLLHAQKWRRGAPAAVKVFRGLAAIPKRYLVDVSGVVSRDPFAARMHIVVAGGFLATCLFAVLYTLGLLPGRVGAYLLLIASVTMLMGTATVCVRRLFNRPARLSGGSFDRLPLGLAAFALFFGWPAYSSLDPGRAITWDSPLGLLLLVLGFYGVWTMTAGLFSGPMKHAFAGALNLAFHPRQERFEPGQGKQSALHTMDLNADRLGIASPSDFAWNRLLSFDACVQCGRCEAVCPAFAAGQPLNPKKLIFDLVAAMDGRGLDPGYSGSPHPGQAGATDPGSLGAPIVAGDTLWSCTTCRACVHECPMMIEHVDAVIDLRRYQTLEVGATPPKAAEMLEELRATDNQTGKDPATRLDWAVDLDLRVLEDGEHCNTLMWFGDGAFDLRSQRTLRALIKLLRLADVDFAVIGNAEMDCGENARRLGDEATFQDLARRNVALLSRYSFDRILTTDPHVLHVLRNEYGAFGGEYRVEHHTRFLAEILEAGRLSLAATDRASVTYHDPCYLGRYNGETVAPRTLLKTAGVDLREMERSGLNSFCCGGGGGAPLSDIPGERRIADMRMDQARATGADVVAVACPNCAIMLEGTVGPGPRVADIAEILADAIGSNTKGARS